MTARTACAATIVIGIMWALIGLIYTQPLHDFGIGVAVAAAGVIGLELVEWIGRRQ